jgi:hypothetical protein
MRYMAVVMLLAAALTGCATRYCERSVQVYESATEKAPLQSPEGLQVPEPDPNYAIPEATGEDVKYATPGTDTKGRARTDCLDTPPALLVATPPPELEPTNEEGSAVETEAAPDIGSEPEVEQEAEPEDF